MQTQRLNQMKRIKKKVFEKNYADTSKPEGPLGELMYHFQFDELFKTRGQFDALFGVMRDIACDKPALLCHINRLHNYHTHDTHPWYDDTVMRPTHVMFTWETPDRMEYARRFKEKGSVSVDIRKIVCFLFYRVEPPSVYILNWVHAGFENDNDRFLPYFHVCINTVKRRHLSPERATNHLIVDIRPIYETFVWFTLCVHFQLDIGEKRDVKDREWLLARRALNGDSLEALRPIVANPRFRTQTTEGVDVLRLSYFPFLCECASVSDGDDGAYRAKAYQCLGCQDIFYCSASCKHWNTCFCNKSR